MTESDNQLPQSVAEHYWTVLPRYIAAVEHAIDLSQKTSGHPADSPREYWALMLFTRLCSAAISMLHMCPGSPENTAGTHWDFSSLAPLVRSLVQTGLMMFYLGTESVGEDESRARVLVMRLRECKERQQLFQNFGAMEKTHDFEVAADQIRTELLSNSYFARLPDQLQKSLMKGDHDAVRAISEDQHSRTTNRESGRKPPVSGCERTEGTSQPEDTGSHRQRR